MWLFLLNEVIWDFQRRLGSRLRSRLGFHESRPPGQSRLARFAIGSGRASLLARVSDGWPSPGRELVCPLLHRSFRYFAFTSKAIGPCLSNHLDAGWFATGHNQPKCSSPATSQGGGAG